MAKSSKSNSKRELTAPNHDKRYIKRDGKGRIKENDDQGRSLSQARRKAARTKVKPDYSDPKDQPNKSAAKNK
jgi:hypothetical protein